MDTQKLSRRGLLAASVVGLGAAGLAGSAVAAPDRGRPAGLTEAVLAAFRSHRLVGLGEEHSSQEHHDVLQTMLADPRLPGVVNDIVVENGNARYQDVVDAFVVEGRPVADTDLRPVWRDTTQAPNPVLDAPVYEQLLRRVRAVNWALPPSRRIRVLLGDPPLDWSTITTSEQLLPYITHRDGYAATVIEQQVLARGRRALLCYGSGHLVHTTPPATQYVASVVERDTGVRTYTIVDVVPLRPDTSDLATRLAGYPRGTVIPTAGSWLGRLDAASALPYDVACGQQLGDLADAGLYLGQPADLTVSWANPAVYLDPTYWTELQRRALIGGKGGQPIDLTSYRQEKPPTYPALPAPVC